MYFIKDIRQYKIINTLVLIFKFYFIMFLIFNLKFYFIALVSKALFLDELNLILFLQILFNFNVFKFICVNFCQLFFMIITDLLMVKQDNGVFLVLLIK